MKRFRHCLTVLAVTALCACAGPVEVTSEYPAPIVEPLPYRVGYLLDFDFRNYQFTDQDNKKISFSLGPQQSALFENVLSAVFAQAQPVESIEASGFDLLLQPKLVEYAYLSPEDTASKFYAASMKYQVRIYDANGSLLGYWPLVAYGKSRDRLLKGNESLAEATSLALRDAAAALSTRFRAAVEKQDWQQDDGEQDT